MSCRSTPPGSLATTFISHVYGLDDGQDTALFHAALRDSRREVEENGPHEPRMLEARYNAMLDTMSYHIENASSWTPGMRSRAARRVQGSRSFDVRGNPHVATALANITDYATTARTQLREIFTRVSNNHGLDEHFVVSEFRRLRKEVHSEPPELSVYNVFFESEGSRYYGVPLDGRTKSALRVLLHGARCGNCGQFVPSQDPSDHTCPVSSAQAASNTRRAPAVVPDIFPGGPETPSEASQSAPAAPIEPPPPWNMEEFQALYDEARARIEAGNTRIPTSPALEAIPGGVTGGLGAREGGLSFGIEMEMDFPDEPWPYSNRYLLAERLYAEGLVMSPQVERWHFVGTGDRPGGEYTVEPGNWVCEFDRSVDDCEGERGLEIKSQILYDEPETWSNLKRICEIAEEFGARPTMRTGLHVNVDGSKFPSDDPARHNALLRLAASYDDTIVRLAHNPESGPRHRGRAYCRYVNTPAEGFRDVNTARDYSNHYQAFNLGHLPGLGERTRPSTRVEHRIWDSTLDPGRIQAAVTVSLAIVQNAIDQAKPGYPAEPAGSHHNEYGRRKLTGERWESATLSFRQLVSLVERVGAKTEHHRRALTSMFAVTRWQQN